MYKCKKCDNQKGFVEYNLVKTYIAIEDGEISNSFDRFVDCVEVICSECNASSEQGDIATTT